MLHFPATAAWFKPSLAGQEGFMPLIYWCTVCLEISLPSFLLANRSCPPAPQPPSIRLHLFNSLAAHTLTPRRSACRRQWCFNCHFWLRRPWHSWGDRGEPVGLIRGNGERERERDGTHSANESGVWLWALCLFLPPTPVSPCRGMIWFDKRSAVILSLSNLKF